MKAHLASLMAAALLPVVASAQILVEPDAVGSYGMSIDGTAVSMLVREAGDNMFEAELSVSLDGQTVFQRTYDEMFSLFQAPILKLVEMDTANDAPELFVSRYSGGAHCCNLVSIIAKLDDGRWSEIDAGAYDGDPAANYPQDATGDGVAEIITLDNSFLYTFASYAGSFAPTIVLTLRDGAVADVTGEPDYEYVLRSALRNLGAMPESGASRNSWLAAHAAMQVRLGAEDPFSLADKDHDPEPDWGLTFCKDEGTETYECPEDRIGRIAFPVALRQFLSERGYME
ncbi:MAG: hypothetical protein JJ920_09445 [Roseitalea sp.]|nr:hypothetical protein [Roseitalea sp.]MBO6721953.1 hypothetical protein [Roseitalea sp.]MBO6743124.1 hypothetical protein [Roseitalea sp.]